MSAVVESVKSAADEAWASAVGGWDWVKSLILGEFQDNRPLSVLITEMLVTFVPGVVIVTSARDAVAVSLRLAKHPERREHVTEWIVLCACLITIALPLAMAAGGAVFAGVGAVVGGIAGSELGAALRAVMLMLAREAAELMAIVKFLQKFVTGNIMTFLKAIKFARYEKAIVQALTKVTDPLIGMCKATRLHLEKGLNTLDKSSTMSWLRNHFDSVKNSSTIAEAKAAVAKLAEWEAAFYGLQRDAVKKIPLALAELDARLSKLLAQTVAPDAHLVGAGVKAEKAATSTPTKQVVADSVAQPSHVASPHQSGSPTTSNAHPSTPGNHNKPPPRKVRPDPVEKPEPGVGTKKQEPIDPVIAAEREHVSQLSKAGKIEEARAYLKERVLDNPEIAPADKPKALIDRLDVSSPKDKAVFWSGDLDAAKSTAAEMGGVTLETTTGGRIADGWEDLSMFKGWDGDPPPNGYDFWGGLSSKYAKGVTGDVTVVQSASRAAQGGGYVWKNAESSILTTAQENGVVGNITYNIIPDKVVTP